METFASLGMILSPHADQGSHLLERSLVSQVVEGFDPGPGVSVVAVDQRAVHIQKNTV